MPEKKRTARRSSGADDERKRSVAQEVIAIAVERYDFGQTTSGVLYAVPKDGHIIRPLRAKGSSRILDELADLYFKKTGRLVSSQSLDPVRTLMRAEASRCEPEDVALRVARRGSQVIIDMGDAAERVVIVDPSEGGTWRISKKSPVRFRRTTLTGAFPEPDPNAHPGDIKKLGQIINATASTFDLLVAWLATQFIPDIPRAMLSVNGEQGSAKTDACRMLARMIDPSPAPMRTPPKSPDDFVTTAQGSYVIGLENLSMIPEWLSNLLCSVVTGVGAAKRELYSDDGVSVMSVGRRAVIINGIEVGGIRSDLADRTLRVELKTIPPHKRMLEREVEDRFSAIWPTVFGALLDVLADTLAVVEVGAQTLEERPRMADFAEWIRAVDLVRNTKSLDRYLNGLKRAAVEAADDDPVTDALRAFLSTAEVGGKWKGSAEHLLANLNAHANEAAQRSKYWPDGSRALGRRLVRLAPSLRLAGWTVKKASVGHGRGWALKLPADNAGRNAGRSDRKTQVEPALPTLGGSGRSDNAGRKSPRRSRNRG